MIQSTDAPQRRFFTGERSFKLLALAAAVLLILLFAFIAAFLTWESLPALMSGTPSEDGSASFWSYVLPFAFGTVWVALLSLALATPVAIGVALFISHYAPRRVARPLGYVVDLLAAIPSVVFGLWGIQVLAPAVQPLYAWAGDHLAWIPLFHGPVSGTGRTTLTAALILAVMILPIITAIMREVFLRTPRAEEEAALALGATKAEMIKIAVLPRARSGAISAMMLGLGRALGETMVVAMVLSPANVISFALLTTQNPNTIAGNIALNFPEAFGLRVNTLIATGLVLFVITFSVNFAARLITNGRRGLKGA